MKKNKIVLLVITFLVIVVAIYTSQQEEINLHSSCLSFEDKFITDIIGQNQLITTESDSQIIAITCVAGLDMLVMTKIQKNIPPTLYIFGIHLQTEKITLTSITYRYHQIKPDCPERVTLTTKLKAQTKREIIWLN